MRVFLFLLLTTAVAAQPIQCVSEDARVEVSVRYESPYELVPISRPALRGLTRTQVGDVAIYIGRERAQVEGVTHYLHVIAERGGSWFQLREKIGGDSPMVALEWPHPQTERAPVISRARAGLPLIRVSWIESSIVRAGLTRWTVLLDFRARPRVLVAIECGDAVARGACVAEAAAYHPREELTCDEELRCTLHQSLRTGWTTRKAARRFDLLTNQSLPPARFDAVTYTSGAAFAAAAPGAIRERAIIDGIGMVEPVHEVSPGVVIFAAHARDSVVAVRFFLLAGSSWREIPAAILSDAGYPGPNAAGERGGSLSAGFTPHAPRLSFVAYPIEFRGKQKLIEVIATEGRARSMHWIIIDPSGRTGALRVATDHPEWRSCGNVVYPVTATFLGIPDSGLPAHMEGIASWRAWDVRDGKLPRTCNVIGSIDWSAKRGWMVKLGQEPCTDPILRPFAAAIDDEGNFRVIRPSLP